MRPDDYAQLISKSVIVDLAKRHDLAIAGQRLEFCCFPLGGMVSLIVADADGYKAEIGVIGRDGMVNSSAVLGNDRATLRTLVQLDGAAVQVDAQALAAASSKSPALPNRPLPMSRRCTSRPAFPHWRTSSTRYRNAWRAGCGCVSTWVRETHVDLTHEALSIMLVTRRAGVSAALRTLQASGVIQTRRGGLAVVDRALLLGIAPAGYGSPEAADVHLILRQPANLVAADCLAQSGVMQVPGRRLNG